MKKLLIFIMLLCVFSCAEKKHIDFGYITFYYGDIEIKHSGDKVKPKLKMILKSGDRIYTRKSARIDIQMQNYGLVRINQNSEVDLEKLINEANEIVNLNMDKGQLLCKLQKLDKAHALNVETPTAVAGIRGTTFMVDAPEDSKESEIAVTEGEVEVASKKEPDQTKKVKQNETAKVDQKSGGLDIAKGINLDKLKELKAVKDVPILKNLKDVKVDKLKGMSLDNLKKLDIKDLKGLGSEFQSLIPSKGKSDDDKPSKVDEAKTKIDNGKKTIDKKKEELNKKKEKLEKDAKKQIDGAKDKLNNIFK